MNALVGATVTRGGRPVLHSISLQPVPGSVLVIIGPNGSGKTTLLEALVASCAPGHLAWLPDECVPPAELTVGEQLELARCLGGATPERSNAVAAQLELGALREARCGALSRGEARRVMLHAALTSSRPLLVLDEPLGTFDPLQLRGVVALLREVARAGAAVVLSVHQLSDAEKLADRVLVLHEGRALAEGTLDELRARAGVSGSLEDVFLALLGARRG